MIYIVMLGERDMDGRLRLYRDSVVDDLEEAQAIVNDVRARGIPARIIRRRSR